MATPLADEPVWAYEAFRPVYIDPSAFNRRGMTVRLADEDCISFVLAVEELVVAPPSRLG